MILPLNWKNDPLLLTSNQRLTLNTQFANAKTVSEKELIVTQPLVNFYGILIKKQEFNLNTTLLSKIRILPRMPYLPLNHYSFLKNELAEHSWILAERVRDYFYDQQC